MGKMYKLSFILLLFILISQLSVAQQVTYNPDTTHLVPGNDDYVNAYINIQNLSGEVIDVEWKTIENTLNPEWKLQFCDFNLCYTNEFNPLITESDGEFTEDYRDDWYLGVALDGEEPDSAIWSVEITLMNTGRKDTLTWAVSNDVNTSNFSIIEKEKTTISLYPNPATTQLNVKRNTGENTPYRILDLTGKMITNGYLNSDNDLIDVAGLSNGIYLLEIQSNDHKELNKFIKQ